MGIEVNIIKEKTNKLLEWTNNQVKNANKNGVVFGLSGGLDSALVAALCKKIFPDNTLGLILPCESQKNDIDDALKVVQSFQLEYLKIDLTNIYHQLLSSINSSINIDNQKNIMAKANIKPRLRMTILYYIANINNYLVVGTGNKSELSIGYFTKYGDGGCDILPIGNIYKSEVKKIAEYLNVPEEIINKPPTAGLWEGQTDEKEMGFSYKTLDNFLSTGKINTEIDKKKILNMIENSKHKRKTPPIPDF
ncbi:MAG: NAD(+) synthase [Atribacterota bacterium]|nr:NAD(+) synthase [Atribacterota bacterium]